jgi:hypothetical protein
MEHTDLNSIQVSVETTTFQRRDRIITVKLKAPKDFFAVADLLSQFGKFENVESYFEGLVRTGAGSYLEKAKDAISKIESK